MQIAWRKQCVRPPCLILKCEKPGYNSPGITSSLSFDAFSTVHTNTVCMHFRFDPLSRAFSNRCVFYENAQHISVDGRPKRIEMYAFSNGNALVWTGPDKVKDWHL